MALSLATIKMNYRQSIAQANKLSDAAEELRRLAETDLGNSLENIRGAWTGGNANLFIQKGDTLKGQLNKTAQSMENTASTIREIAKRIHDAEMMNLNLIQ